MAGVPSLNAAMMMTDAVGAAADLKTNASRRRSAPPADSAVHPSAHMCVIGPISSAVGGQSHYMVLGPSHIRQLWRKGAVRSRPIGAPRVDEHLGQQSLYRVAAVANGRWRGHGLLTRPSAGHTTILEI